MTTAVARGAIERPGATLRWEAGGRGPGLGCWAAWGGDRTQWAWHVPALAERFRVVTWDLRGHGESTAEGAPVGLDGLADDLLAVCDAVGAERALLAGASMGGEITLALAARAPGRVAGMVCAGVAAGAFPEAVRARYRALAARALAEGPAAVTAELAAIFFPPGFLAARPAEARRFQERLTSGAATPLAAMAQAVLAADPVLPTLGRVDAPALVLVGEHDPITPPLLGRAVAAAMPRGTCEVLPGLHHLCLVQDAAGTARRIGEFLGGIG